MKGNYGIAALLFGTVIFVALDVAVLFRAFNQIGNSAFERTDTSLKLKRTNEADAGTRGYLLTRDQSLAVNHDVGAQFVEALSEELVFAGMKPAVTE